MKKCSLSDLIGVTALNASKVDIVKSVMEIQME